MVKKLGSFKNHCANNSINILHDDLVFIDKKLNLFHRNDYKSILLEYIEEWKKGMDSVKNPTLKQSHGRVRANLWLLDKANNISSSY